MKTFWKGLIMALVGFLASTISDLDTVNWIYVAIASGSFILLYVGKNAWKPSTSELGKLNWPDILSGGFIALGMAISDFAGQIITVGFADIDWKAFGLAILYAVIGYFTKTFFAKPIAT